MAATKKATKAPAKSKKAAAPVRKPAKAAAAARKPARKAPARAKAPKGASTGSVTLLISTVKGLFSVKSDPMRKKWKLIGPTMLGQSINHVVTDPRKKGSMLMAGKTGHLGPTIHISSDGGKSWKEASKPPAFDKAPEGETGKAIDQTFFLTPGHKSQPGVWFCGTVPVGLFKSTDGGDTWDIMRGVSEHPDSSHPNFGMPAPGGPFTHSVLIDPRDARHMYLCISSSGVMESTDGGATWKHLNKGLEVDYLPPGEYEFGHDPHCMEMSETDPDILWQQNHCGIYRMDRREGTWQRVGRNMPKGIGDIGFSIVIHPREPNTAWVFPMDGTAVWPRTSPDGAPATYMTKDGGKTWLRQDGGLPKDQGFFTVFRQGMKSDAHANVGLYFGTTNGEVWSSTNGGKSWKCVARWLPRILALEVAR